MLKDYYEILNISSASDPEGIRLAYEKLLAAHKDDAVYLALIKEAFHTLSNEDSRKTYDHRFLDELKKSNGRLIHKLKNGSKKKIRDDIIKESQSLFEGIAYVLITIVMLRFLLPALGLDQSDAMEGTVTIKKYRLACNENLVRDCKLFGEKSDLTPKFTFSSIGMEYKSLQNKFNCLQGCLNSSLDSTKSIVLLKSCIQTRNYLWDENSSIGIMINRFRASEANEKQFQHVLKLVEFCERIKMLQFKIEGEIDEKVLSEIKRLIRDLEPLSTFINCRTEEI